MRQRHCDWRAAIPFVLAPGVEIDIGLTPDHGHRFRPGRAHRDQFGAEPFSDGNSFGGRTGPADQHAQARRRGHHGNRLIGAQHQIECRQSYCADRCHAINRQCDMDSPVTAPLAIFAGAVDRIDDPHPGMGEPFRVVLFFLRQQAIAGPGRTDGFDQKAVGRFVPGLAQ